MLSGAGSAGLASVRHLPQILLGGGRFDARESRQRHGTAVARRTIDRLDDADVLQALDARGLGDAVASDAAGEVLELARVGIDRLERLLLAPAAAHDLEGGWLRGVVGPGQARVAVLTEHGERRRRLLTEARVQVRKPVLREADQRHRAL